MTPLDSHVLALAARLPREYGPAESLVRTELDMTLTRYHQRLNRLLDDPEALAADPLLVNRLRRLRETRARQRRPVRLAG